ncbi:MAG: hypothetical protein IJY89_01925, partial [Clostridia bacterium]|nr:hypothetical protein [Clostridia bacterium]
MSNIEITFEYPWLLLLFLPVTALIILPFFLVPKKRRYTVKRILPLALHVLIAAALVLVLSGFSVTKQISEQAVVLLLDLSDSTETVQASMEAHAKELLRTIDRTVPVGVVAFGEQQVCLIEPQGKDRTLVLKDPGAKATDLEAALHFAASLAPENKALRIILMTDGKETDGTAENAAYELANRGIRLDALYFDTTGLPTEEVQLGSFTAPVGVYKDKDAILSSEIKSNVDCKATVTLYENDLPILEKEYEIVSGSNMIEMTVTPKSAGTYTYRMVVQAPKDTVLKNNEAFACLPVAGRSTVLVIADTNHNAEVLANILKEENDVTAVTAYRAPKSLAELCKYDAVVLSNVHCADLPRYYEETLQEYVGGYGRTLLAVGGRETFMFGDMQETALSDMLPVTLSLEESGEGNSVALMLVLDCSSSMKGDRFMIAKQGAIKCLDAMSDNDYVGV